MNAAQQLWYSFSSPDRTTLRCAECGNSFDLAFPATDHHPRICPVCGVECVFLSWKGRTLQIVLKNTPPALAEALRWGQQHLDELEFVELLCALEEMSDALNPASLAR
jgi:hypothetical protein